MNLRNEAKQLIIPLYVTVAFATYTAFQYAKDHQLIQRSVMFSIITLYICWMEKQVKFQQLLQLTSVNSANSDLTKRNIAGKSNEDGRSIDILLDTPNRGSCSTPKFNRNVKQHASLPPQITHTVEDIYAQRNPLDRFDQPLHLDLINCMDSGMIIYNQRLEVVFKNERTQHMEATFSLKTDFLDIKITKFDKYSTRFLDYSRAGSIQKRSNNSFHERVFSPDVESVRTLRGLLFDMFAIPERAKFITVKCLEYQSDNHSLSITAKLIENKHGVYFAMVQFSDQSERDVFLKRQYTFKIMRQLFMSFSHEFGTSLNYILALAQVAESESIINQDLQNNYFTPIKRAGSMMYLKVQDMLDYNKILGREFYLNLAAFEPLESIEQLKQMFQNTMSHKSLQFNVQSMAYDSKVEFQNDQQRLQQVLVNLVCNAQKFTHQGSVTISLSDVLIRGQQYIKFVVSDTGVGMDDEEQERLRNLITKGVKGMEKVSHNSVGFGLGLLVSNEIALALSNLSWQEGGGINFSSQLNRGSKFWIFVKNTISQTYQETLLMNFRSPLIEISKRQIYDQRTSQINQFNSQISRQELSSNKQFASIEERSNINFSIRDVSKTPKFELSAPTKSIVIRRRQDSEDSIRSEMNLHELNSKVKYFVQPNQTNHVKKSNFAKAFGQVLCYNKQETQQIETSQQECKCNQILVVDDESINIFALQMLLKKFELNSDSVMNGLECIRVVSERLNNRCHCERRGYSMIFMDLNMPLMDGFKATEAIRNMDIKQPIICAVTAFVDNKTRMESYDSGVNYFINKPVQLIELKKVLQFYQIQ